MKETKKQRKMRLGMNDATLQAYAAGHRQKVVDDAGFVIKAGVPYVNHKNFGM